MGEMPVIEGLQAKRAEFRGAKIEDDMRSEDDAKDIEAKKKEIEAANLVKAKDLQAKLIDVKKKIDAGGPLVGTYRAIQALLEEEYDSVTSSVLKSSAENSDTALMQ